MEASPLSIHVRLFALLRERAGCERVEVALAPGATVADLMGEIERRFPALSPHLGSVMVAVNQEYVGPGHTLREGDEVALIPPVSGGAG